MAAAGVFFLSLSGCAVFSGMLSSSNPDWDDPYGPPVADGVGYARPGSATPQAGAPAASGAYRTRLQVTAPLSEDEQAVIASARTLIGRGPESRVLVNGKTFVLDCIGTVSAIFYGMNIDVQKDFRRYGGDGVSRLY